VFLVEDDEGKKEWRKWEKNKEEKKRLYVNVF